MKRLCLVFLFVFLAFTACVSPPMYNNVSTPEGLNLGVGVAYQSAYRSGSWEGAWAASGSFDGVRPDLIISYGVSETFSFEGRFGTVFSSDLHWEELDDTSNTGDMRVPVPMVGLGLKVSSPPDHTVNTALRIDLDFPNIATFTPMLGFSTKNGHEYLTVGVQTAYLLLPRTFFVNIHPYTGFHVYGGIDFLPLQYDFGDLTIDGDSYFESFCVGIAYIYNFRKKEEDHNRY